MKNSTNSQLEVWSSIPPWKLFAPYFMPQFVRLSKAGVFSAVFELQVGTLTPSMPYGSPSYLHFQSNGEPLLYLRNIIQSGQRERDGSERFRDLYWTLLKDRCFVQAALGSDCGGIMVAKVVLRVPPFPLRACDVNTSMIFPAWLPPLLCQE